MTLNHMPVDILVTWTHARDHGMNSLSFLFFYHSQEDEVIPSIYAGLSEDDRFIGKLLTAQNTMVNIQTEFTRLIKDYIQIKKKDQKRREKNRTSTVSGSGHQVATMTGQMKSLQQQKTTKPPSSVNR